MWSEEVLCSIHSFNEYLQSSHDVPAPFLGTGDFGKQNRPHIYFNESSILLREIIQMDNF